MADFNVNLSGPQGAGAAVVAPVQEQVVKDNSVDLLGGIVDIFAKGLAADSKAKALQRKNAIIGEYVKNEQVYADALTTGQWGSSQVGIASRANYNKMLASYPEFITELSEAKKAIYDGTETGEAQKKVDAEVKQRNDDIARASSAGYTFYEGMSDDSKTKAIEASKATVRINNEFDEVAKRNAEQRAQNSEGRSQGTYQRTLQDYTDKENATKGLLEIADRNFDSLAAISKDLMNDPNKTFEQKQVLFNENTRRIRTGLLAISARNPEMAAPWQKLVDEMEGTFLKIADPKAKTESEAQQLRNEYDAQMYKQKLLIIANPQARAAVAVTTLFSNNPALLDMATNPVLVGTLAEYGLGPDAGKKTPVVGTPDEKAALRTIKGALNSLQNGKAQGDKTKLNTEAINTVNEVLKQTGTMQGPISPTMLKDLSSFYASPEFGRMAAEGKVDMPTMQNAKKVFQVSYEPAVKESIMNRLSQPGVMDSIDIRMSGANVSFNRKLGTDKRTIGEQMAGAFNIEAGLQGNNVNAQSAALREAEAGLNTLVHMGAHMEGTTDYNKYWQENKHLLMPGVFMEGLEPGKVVNGYEYLGGDARNKNNYKKVPDAK